MEKYLICSMLFLAILISCDSTYKDLTVAKRDPAISAYDLYMQAHPDKVPDASETAALEELESFNYVKIAHNFPACREFEERYPNSIYIDSLEQITNSIVNERHPILRAIRTVKIRLTHNLGEKKGKFISIDTRIGNHLQSAGLNLINDDSTGYDLLVDIKVSGSPLSAKYRPIPILGGKTHYSGAQVSGSISFISEGRAVISRRFMGTIPTPEWVSENAYLIPDEAPYIQALDKGFYPVWAELLDNAFGPSTLRGILETSPNTNIRNAITEKLIAYDEVHFIQYVAVRQQRKNLSWEDARMMGEILISIGEPALETMLAGLWSPSIRVREYSSTALKEIGKESELKRILEDHIEMLGSKNPHQTRINAILALEKLGRGEAFGPLLELLKDKDREIRTLAWGAMRSILNTYAEEGLIYTFPGPNYDEVIEWIKTNLQNVEKEE